MADSAHMRRGEPVSVAELAQVEGSSDLVPQERMSQESMSQAQLMQLQAIEELQQQADEFWNVTSDYPLPAKNLYLVRVLLLVVPSLIIVYYFIRVTLFPIGAVPLVYLVMHMWLAMIYRANRSVKLVWLANVASGVAAAIMTAFFVYALVTVQGPQTLLDRVGMFYTVSLLTVMASFALEALFSLFYSLAVRRSLRLTRQKQNLEQQAEDFPAHPPIYASDG
ncbi:FlxA-like family protein [uncultured Rothia sp.]|uniref:FlxA-like family protein n=1 Tax=uncultured Rothia sp. TaxID=316088 RepID=UPI0025DD49A2|nr:FlxA-like family protein [uncultured Rothia sp.]